MPRFLRPPVAKSPRRTRRPTHSGGSPVSRGGAIPLEALETRTLFAAGDLDPSFGPGGADGDGIVTTNIATINAVPTSDAAQTILVQPDNKILVGGWADPGLGADFAIARYNPDGSLDANFGVGGPDGNGVVTTDFGDVDQIQSIALTSDGHIVAVGSSGTGSFADFAVAVFKPDGTLEPTFSPGGPEGDGRLLSDFFTRNDVATGVAVDANNRIVVTGTATGQTTQIAVARYNPNGSFDTTFDTDGKAFVDFFEGADAASDVKVQPDNKIIVVGASAPAGSYRRFVLVRFNPDGTPDASFGSQGKATADFGAGAYAKDVVVEPGLGYVVGGLVDGPGGGSTMDYAVARFNDNGTLDTAFGAGGRTVVTDFAGSVFAHYGLARQSNGKYLLGGLYAGDGATTQNAFGLARFNPDGTVDASFGTGGTVRTTVPGATGSAGADLALQADGRIVMAGDALRGNAGGDFAVVRYLNTVTAAGTISGTVFEDANGNGVRDAGERALPGITVYQDLNGNSTLDTGRATISSADVPKNIPDRGTVTSTLPVTGVLGDILDVNVSLSIEHTFDPDLNVTLISPAGTRVLLFSGVGGNPPLNGTTANFNNTTIDDQATVSINAGNAPFPGTYRPQQPLSALNGQSPTGTWRLEVVDTATEDTGQLTAWSITLTTRGEPSTVTTADGGYVFPNLSPGGYTIRAVPPAAGFTQTNPANGGARLVTLAEGQSVPAQDFGFFQGSLPAEIVGRHVFYNNSAFDGRDVSAGATDINGIDPDKQALLPGELGTFASVTSYVRGLNGVEVEFRNLPAATTFSAADFRFRSGNGTSPAAWTTAPAPVQVSTVRSPIPEQPARVFITFADGSIVNQWLQVTVLANANTGLRTPDVFYFGNLVGETGDQPNRLMSVTQRDELAVRRNLRSGAAAVDSRYDFDRDRDVDATDLLILRRNLGARLSTLGGPQTAAPGAAPAAAVFSAARVAPAPAALRPTRLLADQPAGVL